MAELEPVARIALPLRERRLLELAIVAMTLLGCAGPVRKPLEAAPRPSPPAPTAAAMATARVPAPTAAPQEMVTGWHLVHYPSPSYNARPFGIAADGTERWAIGGLRAELRHGIAVVAKDELADELAASCASGKGFVHFTATGGAYWSSTFLGDLKALGQTDSQLSVLQCGPAAITDTAARVPQLWGESGSRLLAVPPGAIVTMSDGQAGHAITYPDRGFETRDGGKTFTPQPRATRPHPTFDLPQPIAPHDAKFALLDEAWLERMLESPAARALYGGQLSDGTSYVSVARGEGAHLRRVNTLVKLAQPSGAPTTLRLDHRASLVPWGTKLLDTYSDAPRIAYPAGEGSLPPPPAPGWEFRADPAGAWIFGASDGGLLRFDGQLWTRFKKIKSRPLDVNAAWLLLDEPLRVVPAAHPDAAPYLLTTQDDCAWGRAALSADRLLQIRCAESDPNQPPARRHKKPAELVEIELGSWTERSSHRLPEDNAKELWGAPAGGFRPSAWECNQGACRLGWRDAWIEVSTPAVTNLWPPLPEAPSRPQRGVLDPPPSIPSARFDSQGYLCQSSQGQLQDSALRGFYKAGLYRPRGGGWTIESINGAGGQIDWPTPTHSAMEWSGRDSRGSFRAALAQPQGLADYQREMIDEADGTTFAYPFLVARNYALVSAPGYNYPLWILRSGGGVQSLVVDRPLVAPPATVPLPNGGALIRSVTREYQTLRVLDGRGNETARRDLLRGPAGYGDLALLGGRPGLVQWDGQDFRFFSLTPGSAGSVVTLPTQRQVDLCQAATPLGALTLINPGFGHTLIGSPIGIDGIVTTPPSVNVRVDGATGNVGYTWFEIDGPRACVRAIIQAQPYSVETYASGGALTGWINAQDGSHDLNCAVPPPPPPLPPTPATPASKARQR